MCVGRAVDKAYEARIVADGGVPRRADGADGDLAGCRAAGGRIERRACSRCAGRTSRRKWKVSASCCLEGAAQGLPAVVTNVHALPEVVVNGFTGWVCEGNDPSRLVHGAVGGAGGFDVERNARRVRDPRSAVHLGSLRRSHVSRAMRRPDASMRIAIINSHYYPDEHGGAERSLRFLAEAAVALGHECTVFTTGDSRESTELNGVGSSGFSLRKAARGVGGRARQAHVASAGYLQLRRCGRDVERDSSLRPGCRAHQQSLRDFRGAVGLPAADGHSDRAHAARLLPRFARTRPSSATALRAGADAVPAA